MKTPKLDLDEILGQSRGSQRFDPALAKERNHENVRRINRARQLAWSALQKLHPDEYAILLAQAKDKVNAQRGPLPGDPS